MYDNLSMVIYFAYLSGFVFVVEQHKF